MKVLISLLRRIKRRVALKRRINRIYCLVTGQYVSCNLCGWIGKRLASDIWHPETICPDCGSQVRHRLLCAAMTHLDGLTFEQLARNKTILHFAPEPALRQKLQCYTTEYLAADYLAEGYQYKLDMQTDLSNMHNVRAEQIDLLVACDVLEHMPDHLGALREIYRVLKYGGWAVLTVPQKDNLEKTFEDSAANTPQERERLFGQHDHLRIYGNDFSGLLTELGFKVRQICETDFAPELVRKNVLFPPHLSTHPLATNYRKVFFAHKVCPAQNDRTGKI